MSSRDISSRVISHGAASNKTWAVNGMIRATHPTVGENTSCSGTKTLVQNFLHETHIPSYFGRSVCPHLLVCLSARLFVSFCTMGI